MKQHKIQITFDASGNPVPLSADGKQTELKREVATKDKISWTTPHGTVDVEFQGATPFANGIKKGGAEPQTVTAESGTFRYRCTVTIGRKKFGWPDNAKGGGTVEVGSGSRTGSVK